MKKYTTYFLVFLVVGFVLYKMFQTTDEIGYLGAGKVGRQVFIQTLNELVKPTTKVTSEFFDRSLIMRFLLGASLRTTIRFDFQDLGANRTTEESAKKYLNSPVSTITQFLGDTILLQEEFALEKSEFKKLMDEKNIVTVEDFYAGFGFKKYEVYVQGKPKVSIEIKNVKNVKHAGF